MTREDLDKLLGGSLEERIQIELARIEGRTILTGDASNTAPIELPQELSDVLPAVLDHEEQIHALVLVAPEAAHTAPIDITSVLALATLEPATESIAVIAPPVIAADQAPMTPDAAIVEAESFPASRRELWTRFTFGLVLALLALAVGTFAATPGVNVAVWVAVSVVASIVSVWVIASAIHENDQRLAALQTAGLQ